MWQWWQRWWQGGAWELGPAPGVQGGGQPSLTGPAIRPATRSASHAQLCPWPDHPPAGLWLAPQMVGEALKGGRLAAQVLGREGYQVTPAPGPCTPWSFITGGWRRQPAGSFPCRGAGITRYYPGILAQAARVCSPAGSLRRTTVLPAAGAESGSWLAAGFLLPCRSRGAGQQGAHGGLLPRGAAVLPHRLVHPARARWAGGVGLLATRCAGRGRRGSREAVIPYLGAPLARPPVHCHVACRRCLSQA